MSNDFDDILSAFKDDDTEQVASTDNVAEEKERTAAPKQTQRKTAAFAQKRPAGSPRPAAAKKPAAAAPIAATTAAAKLPLYSPPPSARPTGNGRQSLLLVLILLFCIFSLLFSALTYTRNKALQTELRIISQSLEQVKVSAERAWKVQCGIYVPVPNQRPQEYQIRYDEKDGQLIRTQMISKPIE